MGNSKEKETFIDPILKLEESQQGILMNIMLKYVRSEEGRKSIMHLDSEVLESVQQQLKDKESDRLSILDQVAKLELENKEQSRTVAEMEKKLKASEHENQRLRGLIEELEKKGVAEQFVAGPVDESTPAHFRELEGEIAKLQKQLDQANEETKAREKTGAEEATKLRDELYMAQQRIAKLAATEKIVEQQRKQIETLESTQSEQMGLAGKVEAYEIKIQEIERNRKQLADEYTKLSTRFYEEVNRGKSNAEELHRVGTKISKMEEDMRGVEEKQRYWEQRAKDSEEKLKSATEENDSLRLTTSAGNLLSQEQELKYKDKIVRLEEQVTLLNDSSSVSLTKKVADLEARLETTNSQKARLEQDLLLLNKRHEELQKEHAANKEELESYKLDKSNTIDMTKECQRIKKDRDMLLEVAAKTQDIAAKYEELKKSHEKLLADLKSATEKFASATKERQELDTQLQQIKGANLELEKRSARQEEKIVLLQDERKKNEELIQDIIQRSDQVWLRILICCDRRKKGRSRRRWPRNARSC